MLAISPAQHLDFRELPFGRFVVVEYAGFTPQPHYRVRKVFRLRSRRSDVNLTIQGQQQTVFVVHAPEALCTDRAGEKSAYDKPRSFAGQHVAQRDLYSIAGRPVVPRHVAEIQQTRLSVSRVEAGQSSLP